MIITGGSHLFCLKSDRQITIYNLLDVERRGPAVLSSHGQKVRLEAALIFKDVIFKAKFRLKRKRRILRPRGSITAIMEHLVANVSLHANVG